MMNRLEEVEFDSVVWSASSAMPDSEDDTVHFVQELNDDVEETEARLQSVLGRLHAIETLHNRMLAKLAREAAGSRQRDAWARSLMAQRDAMEAELNLDRLLAEHRHVTQRFAAAVQALMIANTYSLAEVVAVKLRSVFFPDDSRRSAAPGSTEALKELAAALHDYLWEDPCDANDLRVRLAWSKVERRTMPCH